MVTITAAELNLVIKAKDQSKKTFTAMKSHFTKLRANAKRVGQAMNRALGAGLRKTMNLTKKAMLGIAIAIAAVSAAVIKLRNDAKTYILQIDKMTKVTGMSTEEFSKLAYAAEQEHASLETLSKTLPKLAKYMGQAKDGMATYTREFDKMGIKVTDAKGKLKSSYQVLLEMSDFMGRKGVNDTEKMSIMMTLLGKSGAEMIPLLKMGSAWFNKMGKEAERFGVVLDKKTVAAIKAADDSLTALKTAFLGVGIAIIKAIEPSLERAQDALKEYVIKAKNWIDEHREDIRKKLTDAWVKVESAMRTAWNFMKKMMDAKWKAEQYEKIKEAFQEMVPYIQGAAIAMTGLWAAAHLTVVEIGFLLAGYKLIYEIGKKLGGAGRWAVGKGISFTPATKEDAKFMKSIGFSQKKINEYMSGHSAKRGLDLQREGMELMKEKASVLDFLIDRSKKAIRGELSMAGEFESALSGFKSKVKEAVDVVAEGFKATKEGLEPAKKIKETAEKQKEIAGANNKLLKDRIKIYADLQAARAKIPVETGRVGKFGKMKGDIVFTKEHPVSEGGIPAEEFDKIVADAKAEAEALKATINTLLLKYKDKDVTDDALKEAFDTAFKEMLSFETSAINTAKQQAAAAVKIGNQSAQNSSAIKQIGNKLSSVVKTVSAVTQRQKQLEGQLA